MTWQHSKCHMVSCQELWSFFGSPLSTAPYVLICRVSMEYDFDHLPYELESTLLVSPLVTPKILPIIPYLTPIRSLNLCRPMTNKPPPFLGLNIRIPSIIPTKGKGLLIRGLP